MYIKTEYYSILNSKRTDTLSVIKNNYRNLVKIHHPDVGGDEEYFKKINLAMDIINEFHQENTNTDNFKSTTENNTKKSKSNKKSTNYKNSSKNTYKTSKENNTKNYNKNGRCNRCGSRYEKGDVFCNQCGHKIKHKKYKDNNNEDIELLCIGVVIIGVGLLLLSVFWPIGIIYFYLLYKYLTS